MLYNRIVSFLTKYIIAVLLPLAAVAQAKVPYYEFKPVEIKFSAGFTGLMNDPTHKIGSELVYKYNGQLFDKTDGQLPAKEDGFDGTTKRSTPWETIGELIYAYREKNFDKILSLYNLTTQDQLIALLAGDKKEKFLNHVSKITEAKILAGFEYKEGILVIYESKELGISSCYMLKKKKKYVLASFNDDGPEAWNLSLYFKFKPEPITVPLIQTPLDSFGSAETKRIDFKLNKANNFITVCGDKLGQAVLYNLKDNSEYDLNPEPGVVGIDFNKTKSAMPKEYTLYIAETNYPLTMVSEPIIKAAKGFTFKVYKK